MFETKRTETQTKDLNTLSLLMGLILVTYSITITG